MNQVQAEILYPYSFSLNFPGKIAKEILRDNYIQTVKNLLDQDHGIVFISGEDEVGKSTFLSQFARRFPTETITCFIKPTNQFSSNIENIIFDISRQIHFILFNQDQPIDTPLNLQSLQDYFNKLNRFSKGRKKFYIIVDGLENIDDAGTYQLKTLFDVLPLGLNCFKFIFSEYGQKTYDRFLELQIQKGKIKYHNFIFPGFSFGELEDFLKELNLTSYQLQEIQKLSNQLPGRVKNIHEILNTGVSYEELIDNINIKKYSDILEFQWNHVDQDNEDLLMVIAVIALEESSYTIDSLTKFLKIESSVIKKFLSPLSFLQIWPQTEIVQFKSITIKKYFKERLLRFKNNVEEAIINYLIEDSTSIESIIELPKRLEKAERFEDLIKFLSEENFAKIIDKKESFSFIEEQAEIGIRAAAELKRYPELFRLSIAKSSVSELKQSYIWESEIEAKIELKQFDSAFNLAQESILKEDRFKLLTYLAKKLREKGLNVDSEILNSIKLLYEQINPVNFVNSDEIIEIASNLLYSFPDLAINFIDKVSGNDGVVNSDLGFARLALLLRKIDDKGGEDTLEKFRDISSRIQNPQIKHIANAFGFLFGDGKIETFLLQIKEIQSSNEQLQIIRIYLKDNQKSAGVNLVIDYSIDLLLKSASESPITSTTLSELSEPLPYIKDPAEVRKLIDRFEPLFQTSKDRGPTIDHIKFLLNIACTELKLNKGNSLPSFIDIDIQIELIKDLGLKTECLAIFYSRVKQFDKEGELEKKKKFESNSLARLEYNFDTLLSETAHHFKISRKIIRETCKVNPNKGIYFSLKLNTSFRRDQALQTGLKSYLRNDCIEIDKSTLNSFVKNISDFKIKTNSISEIIERYSNYEGDVLSKFHFLIQYFSEVKTYFSNSDKGLAYSLILRILSKSPSFASLQAQYNKEIKEFFTNLSNRFDKINLGFKISTSYLSIDKSISMEYHRLAVSERELLNFDSPIALTLYFNSLRLAIQSFGGLYKSGTFRVEDPKKLIEYIKYIPDPVSQVRAYSYLILKVYDRDKMELFNSLFDQTIKPFVNAIINTNADWSPAETNAIIIDIATITYLYDKDLFFELHKKCDFSYKDFCVDSVCEYLISKRIPSDSYDFEDADFKIESNDVLSLLNLLDLMHTDYLIWDRIKELNSCVKNNCVAKDILPLITDKLKKIVDAKLPDKNNIKHNGYKLLCFAYILAMERSKDSTKWSNLVKYAKEIPNKSDQAYVLSCLIKIIPDNVKAVSKSDILKEAILNLDEIHSYVARVERYSEILRSIKEVDIFECKAKMRAAIEDSVYENNNELFDSQKEIIDYAYGLDPSFAEELIKIIDDDPARKAISSRHKKRIRSMSLEKDFLKDKYDAQSNEAKQLASFCENFLSKLNSKRVASKHLVHTYKWLTASHALPISKTFSIYSAFIENANVRWDNNRNEVKNILQPLFDFTMKNVQMVKVLAIKSKRKRISSREIIFTPIDSQLIVKPGDREKALNYLRNWIKNEVVEYLKICDPYFSSDDISLIKEVLMIKPDVKIYILAQLEHSQKGNLSEIYQDKWNNICDQDPPETKITIVGYRNGGGGDFLSPNHDRWYLTYNSGLRSGTSFNSLGLTKNSELTIMSSVQAKNLESEVLNKYFNGLENYHLGNRLRYFDFSL